jgi:hypothetical protein
MQARLADPFIDMLSAPVTEFVTVTIKPGHTVAELQTIVPNLARELKKSIGCHGSSWGPSVEKPDVVFFGVVGWDSVAVSGSPTSSSHHE